MKKIFVTFFIMLVLFGSTSSFAYAQVAGALNGSTGVASHGLLYTAGNFMTGGALDTANSAAQAAQSTAAAVQKISSALNCLNNPIQCSQLIFASVVQWIGNIILEAISWFLWLSGILFNLSIVILVIQMKGVMNSIGVIYDIWKTIRDLANMFFIFILLYISISIIIDSKTNVKKMLTNVVLVALFLNFSFFITGVMIDASNIVALQFYNGFAGGDCLNQAKSAAGASSPTQLEKLDGCMSYKVVQALKIQTIYDSKFSDTSNKLGSAATLSSAPSVFVAAANGASSDISKFIISIIAGSVLMMVVASIFIASTILIFWRFIELIMLLMLSPLAFICIVIPTTSGYWKEWWKRLTKQLVFAPVYFMFLWICFKAISNGSLSTTLGATGSFQDAFSAGADPVGIFGLIANYLIIIFLFLYSMKLAVELGGAGAKTASKVAKSVQGFVGRNTVGRAASSVANSETMKDLSAKNPTIGRVVRAPFSFAAGASFGGRKGGYEKATGDYVKKQEAYAKTLAPTPFVAREAEKKQKAAKEDYNRQKTAIEVAVNKKYADDEQKVSPERIAAAEDDLRKQKAASDKLKFQVSTHSADAALSETEKERQRKAADDAEKLTTEKEKLVKDMREKQIEIEKQKKVDIENAMKPYKERVERANNVTGIKKDDATEQAKNIVQERIKNETSKIIKENAGISQEDATKEARKRIDESNEIKKETEKIMKATPSIGKTRQEEFAKSTENKWFVGKRKRIAAAEGIRKNVIKDKDVMDQIQAVLKKSEEESTKESKGNSEKNDKSDDKKST